MANDLFSWEPETPSLDLSFGTRPVSVASTSQRPLNMQSLQAAPQWTSLLEGTGSGGYLGGALENVQGNSIPSFESYAQNNLANLDFLNNGGNNATGEAPWSTRLFGGQHGDTEYYGAARAGAQIGLSLWEGMQARRGLNLQEDAFKFNRFARDREWQASARAYNSQLREKQEQINRQYPDRARDVDQVIREEGIPV